MLSRKTLRYIDLAWIGLSVAAGAGLSYNGHWLNVALVGLVWFFVGIGLSWHSSSGEDREDK